MFFKTAIRWTQNIVKTYDKEKNKIEKHCWEKYHNFNWDKKIVDMESRLIPRNLTQTINSLKNPNLIDKISYNLLEK